MRKQKWTQTVVCLSRTGDTGYTSECEEVLQDGQGLPLADPLPLSALLAVVQGLCSPAVGRLFSARTGRPICCPSGTSGSSLFHSHSLIRLLQQPLQTHLTG